MQQNVLRIYTIMGRVNIDIYSMHITVNTTITTKYSKITTYTAVVSENESNSEGQFSSLHLCNLQCRLSKQNTPNKPMPGADCIMLTLLQHFLASLFLTLLQKKTQLAWMTRIPLVKVTYYYCANSTQYGTITDFCVPTILLFAHTRQ